MTDLGTATPMDRQKTCVGVDEKTGHLIGIDCGKFHYEHVCLFDLTQPHRLCAAYPKCRKRLRKRPRANIPGRVWICYELIAIRWEVK
jgi:hypothetical protein